MSCSRCGLGEAHPVFGSVGGWAQRAGLNPVLQLTRLLGAR
jgi:hypothetical protein